MYPHQPLSSECQHFLIDLHRRFESRRQELLSTRRERSLQLKAGKMPCFHNLTPEVEAKDWRVGSIPSDLLDRRVEITGPVETKMIINALNSGAKVFMADFEDSHSPTWQGTLEGHRALMDAVRGTLEFKTPDKHYRLKDRPATLMVRPRGWHLNEKHFLVDGQWISGALFDFGVYFFNNAKALIEKGSGPYFYLPKLEAASEAVLWNDVFCFAQESLGIARGTIRATVLIETITAAFEMESILWALKEHSAGLNCGRWDYIFSFIKKFAHDPSRIMPDRSFVTMDQHFLKSYVNALVQICHRRGAHAMGGMAAFIPIKDNPEANEKVLEKVRADKTREVLAGHDGTWVAHPALVPIAMEIFDQYMKTPNQITKIPDVIFPKEEDLLQVPSGPRTEESIINNTHVALVYLESWLAGKGCVPIFNLMEDAATAEISRAQLWQWIHHKVSLSDGRLVTLSWFEQILAQQKKVILEKYNLVDSNRLEKASWILRDLVANPEFTEFLTLPCYEFLN